MGPPEESALTVWKGRVTRGVYGLFRYILLRPWTRYVLGFLACNLVLLAWRGIEAGRARDGGTGWVVLALLGVGLFVLYGATCLLWMAHGYGLARAEAEDKAQSAKRAAGEWG